MRYSDLHTHTVFSDGANTPEEMVSSAISRGLLSLGISDHSFTSFDKSYCMKASKGSEYIKEIKRLKEKYSAKIQLYLGLEVDAFASLSNRESYDYIISDSHYIKTSDGIFPIDETAESFSELANNYFGGSTAKLAECYFEQYAEGVKKHRPDILGHIDLVRKFSLVKETNKKYINASLSALTASLEVTPVIELNTGALSRGYKAIYPSEAILKEVKAHKGIVILSSDSHSAQSIAYSFDMAAELLRTCGFSSMAIYDNHKFKEIKI